MESIKRIKVFISCTSEIKEEINSINLVIKEIIKTSGKKDNFTVEALNWNRDVYSSRGSEVQEVVNEQIKDFDLLIGILWKKAGTPTKNYASGSIEEILLALNNNKNVMVFFNTESPSNINEIDPEQLKIIKEFKSELTKIGFLYKEYNSIENFESLIKVDLYNIIHDRILNSEKQPEIKTSNISENKYAHIYKVIDESENDKRELDSNFLEVIEKGTNEVEILTNCMTNISDIFNNFNLKLNSYTDKLVKANSIKDNRLRLSKTDSTIGNVTNLLLSFNSDLEPEYIIFDQYFLSFVNTYSSIFIMVKGIENDEIVELKTSALFLKSTIEESLNTFVALLKSIRGVPPFNEKFNIAKRNTEILIKDLTKSMLDGLITFDNIDLDD